MMILMNCFQVGGRAKGPLQTQGLCLNSQRFLGMTWQVAKVLHLPLGSEIKFYFSNFPFCDVISFHLFSFL